MSVLMFAKESCSGSLAIVVLEINLDPASEWPVARAIGQGNRARLRCIGKPGDPAYPAPCRSPVPISGHQLFEETVFLDIAFGPRRLGLDAEEVEKRVLWAARIVGLTDEELERSPLSCQGANVAGQPLRA